MPHVIFIRHAESVANAGEKTLDPVSTALSAKGIEQAEALVKTISVSPMLIITSTFDRAKNTALPLVRRFPNVPFEEWEIQEFTYLAPDKYRGTTVTDRYAAAHAYWERGDVSYLDGPGAETFFSLVKRCEETAARLKNLENGTVIAFSHQQFISAVQWFLEGRFSQINSDAMRRFRRFLIEQPLENCGRYEVDL